MESGFGIRIKTRIRAHFNDASRLPQIFPVSYLHVRCVLKFQGNDIGQHGEFGQRNGFASDPWILLIQGL